jgi:hypothetical protein
LLIFSLILLEVRPRTRDFLHDHADDELPPRTDESRLEFSVLVLPLPLVVVASSSSYRAFCSMYSTTGAGIKYCMLISLLRNIRIFVELTSFWMSCWITSKSHKLVPLISTFFIRLRTYIFLPSLKTCNCIIHISSVSLHNEDPIATKTTLNQSHFRILVLGCDLHVLQIILRPYT